MLWYSLSWLALSLGDEGNARTYAREAQAASPDYCFPARIEEMIVLESAIQLDPSQARAHYYLGNLFYDKRRYEDGLRCWRKSIELDDTFSIPFRNLGIAEFNIHHDPEAASQMYARAFSLAPNDARVLYEWDQLRKRADLSTPAERLRFLEAHLDLVAHRDDLTIEYITLLNQSQQWKPALEHLAARHFTPWEGGEGLVSAQYVHAHRALGLSALAKKNPEEALRHFEAARHYPHNLGEGKQLLTLERDLDYFSGLAARSLDHGEASRGFWSVAGAPFAAPGMHTYFQGLALRAMGDEEAAFNAFSNLAAYAEQLASMKPVIDYFATSLPNLLLFEDDLDKRNNVDALLLSALAHDGLGNTEKAVRQLEQLLVEDPNHLLAAELLRWIGIRTGLLQATPEGRSTT
jgi:tetratricopeptide (TPR) repeat protein